MGKYPANWQGLSFETLAAVKEKVGDMPLVLHGGTGIPEDMIKKAISGRCKAQCKYRVPAGICPMLRESTSKQERIWKERALTRESFWLPAQRPSKRL